MWPLRGRILRRTHAARVATFYGTLCAGVEDPERFQTVREWPAAVEIVNATGTSPVVLLCPHASNYIAPRYANLGLPPSEWDRHIAWDIGAAAVTRKLAAILDAAAFLGTYSRLLIDLNRPLDSESSIVGRSEATDIPGNVSITMEERALRAARVFLPHHEAIAAHLAARRAGQRPSVIVAIHSFTPTYHGVARTWHAGVLFVKSVAFAHASMERLRASDASLNVGANVPYTVTPDTDYGVLVYGDDIGNPALEFEIRQDLIAHADGQEAWAHRIAQTLAVDVALSSGNDEVR
jgi:predicted N-formylglutamate amidohydrolase